MSNTIVFPTVLPLPKAASSPLFGGFKFPFGGREILVPGLPSLPPKWRWIVREYMLSGSHFYNIQLYANAERFLSASTARKNHIIGAANSLVQKVRKIANFYGLPDWGVLSGRNDVYNLRITDYPTGWVISLDDYLRGSLHVEVRLEDGTVKRLAVLRTSKERVEKTVNHFLSSFL